MGISIIKLPTRPKVSTTSTSVLVVFLSGQGQNEKHR